MSSDNELDIAWCLNNGAISTQWNTAWMQALIANGAREGDALNDMKAQFFEDTYGYTGSLNDKENQWKDAGRPDAVTFDYNGTVVINDMGGTFYGTTSELDFTPSDSCGLPLLLAERYNAFFGFSGGTIRLATSGDETVYASVDIIIPEYSASPITLTLTTTNWEVINAGLYAWLQTQVGNTVGFQVTGTPA